MSRNTLTQDHYDLLADGFRLAKQSGREPKYHNGLACKHAGVDPKTAKRAWDRGWPDRDWMSIKELLETERIQARAILLEAETQQKVQKGHEREAAITHVAQQTAKESKLVSLARSVTSMGLEAVAAVSKKAQILATLIEEQIDADCERQPDDAFKLSATQGMVMLDRLASTTGKLLVNARQAMEMERLHLGHATDITEQRVFTEMTLDEADTRIDAAQQALAAAKASGGLKVISGGLETPVIGKKVNLI